MAFGDGDRGVGGWLAFFLVTLGLISPAFIIYTTVDLLNEPMLAFIPGLRTAELVLAGLMLAICWFAVWRFLKVFEWTTVVIGIVSLWVLALLNVVVEPLIVASLTGLDFGLVVREAGPTLFRPLVYATIWTLYLLNSKRVRATYGGRSGEEVSEVFE